MCAAAAIEVGVCASVLTPLSSSVFVPARNSSGLKAAWPRMLAAEIRTSHGPNRRFSSVGVKGVRYTEPMRLLALLLAGPAAILNAQLLTPAWIEIGPEGIAIARVVVTSETGCPTLRTDGSSIPMSLRQPVPKGLRPACEATIPPSVKSASVNGQR